MSFPQVYVFSFLLVSFLALFLVLSLLLVPFCSFFFILLYPLGILFFFFPTSSFLLLFFYKIIPLFFKLLSIFSISLISFFPHETRLLRHKH